MSGQYQKEWKKIRLGRDDKNGEENAYESMITNDFEQINV